METTRETSLEMCRIKAHILLDSLWTLVENLGSFPCNKYKKDISSYFTKKSSLTQTIWVGYPWRMHAS